MDKQEALEYLIKSGIWVKDGKIAKADLQKVVAMLGNHKALAKVPSLTINIKDPKAAEIMDMASKAGLDWSLSGKKLVIKSDGSEKQDEVMVKAMGMASNYALAEAKPKTQKGKKLLQELTDGGFEVKSMGAEQYGTRRFVYVRFISNEERLKAEKFLTEKGYKVNKKYWPGSGTAEVFIGSYNGKYDGHVEAANFDIKTELTTIVDEEIKMSEESDYNYEGKPERIVEMKEIRAKIQETDFDSYNSYSKIHKELKGLFMDTSPRERIFLAFEKHDED